MCPARVHTPFVDGYLKKNYPGKEQEKYNELAAYQPIGRMGKPEVRARYSSPLWAWAACADRVPALSLLP